MLFPGFRSAAELAATSFQFQDSWHHRAGHLSVLRRGLFPELINADGATAAVIIAAAEVFISVTSTHWNSSFLMFILSVKRTGLILSVNGYPQGGCGSAGSYNPELTTPFHDMEAELVALTVIIFASAYPTPLC